MIDVFSQIADWVKSSRRTVVFTGAGMEVVVPPTGQPLENRKITRELAEANWMLWNEEQDYVAYGGKQPQR